MDKIKKDWEKERKGVFVVGGMGSVACFYKLLKGIEQQLSQKNLKATKWQMYFFLHFLPVSLISKFGASLLTMMIPLALLSLALFPRVFCPTLTVPPLAWLLPAAVLLLGRETEVTHHPRTFVICCSVGPVKTHFLIHSMEFFSGYVSSLLREPTVARKASVMQCGTLPSLSWQLTSSHLIHLG